MEDRSRPPANVPVAQSVVFTVIGRYRLEDNSPLSTGAYIDVLGRAGVSANATRLILGRMVDRGFLHRARDGRTAYWSATDLALDFARRQLERTFPSSPAVDGAVWTILTFSMPEDHRKERDLLRKRLEWDGFGLLRDGVWIAAGDRELDGVLDRHAQEEVGRFVEVFTAHPKLVDVKSMISRAWDLDAVRRGYELFLGDWDVPHPAPMATDALGRILLLLSSWRRLSRETSRLPAKYLDHQDLATRSNEVFHAHYEAERDEADALFARLVTAPGALFTGGPPDHTTTVV